MPFGSPLLGARLVCRALKRCDSFPEVGRASGVEEFIPLVEPDPGARLGASGAFVGFLRWVVGDGEAAGDRAMGAFGPLEVWVVFEAVLSVDLEGDSVVALFTEEVSGEEGFTGEASAEGVSIANRPFGEALAGFS
ncbi:hypothetical protein MPNT_40168 [Candidatus Methylacidithermus pantelleriae]|uniref:Uncharacterized protein n=1 Tax=Candidatus Methylacidithermus pantelleriae TaxID=2744239 RepID=A0A8J2FPB4_9BACT|nr:hypothetical protein MPNT_40168 [Candidatus Methylacidithermus pantelleriae]